MENKTLFLYGSGGHAKVVCDIIENAGFYTIEHVLDDDKSKWGKPFYKYSILGGVSAVHPINSTQNMVIGIGNNQIRVSLSQTLASFRFPDIIHPSSIIGKNVSIAQGTVVMGNTIINPDTTISSFCIINTGVTIDHDCRLEKGVHIAPGSVLCGHVDVGENTLVGAGTVVIENMTIGKNCIIGAGSVIVKDIPDYTKVIGCELIPLSS